jgi:hypothetical protein
MIKLKKILLQTEKAEGEKSPMGFTCPKRTGYQFGESL